MANTPDPKLLLRRALSEVKVARAKLEAAERARREPIALVGIGCRLPGDIDGPEALWARLVEGVDCTSEVPPDRWDAEQWFDPDPDAPGKTPIRRGGFLREVDRFAARFFRVSPREAQWMDPQHRLLLEVSWEALEDAGIAPDRLHGEKVGVFVGISNNDYAHLHGAAAITGEGGLFHVSGGAFSFAAGRLAYTLGVHGPALAVDTACSSSLVALHLACQSLRAGECDLAVVGGVNLILAPGGFVVLSKARMLAPDGRCKTFDAAADGYARGEGCGVVVLRRLGDARAAGDRIVAVVRGTAVNQDGASSGLTVPNGAAQRALVEQALRSAGTTAAEVGYVEAHGTGTSLGDPIEARALSEALCAARSSDAPLWVGSIKTNVGHLESAAGIAGLIKAALVVHHGQIPPSLHFRSPSPHIDFAGLGLAVPVDVVPWPQGQPRCAGVSSFGASGTNAHAVLAAPPPADPAETSPAETSPVAELLVLSARSEAELRVLADRTERRLAELPEAGLVDVCAAAAAGRAQLEERLALVVPTAEAARGRLTAFAQGEDDGVLRGRATTPRPRVALLFSGQGAQYAGMAHGLMHSEPGFRATIERCDAALGDALGARLLDVLTPDHPATRRIDETGLAQPALFAVEVALAGLLRDWGVEPHVVLGHSVGELAAACVAGALTLEDGLALVAARARAMQALPPGGAMAAVFTDEATVREAIEGEPALAIAAINAPDECVVSGAADAVARALERLEVAGVRSRRLQVSHAFHSPLVDPMLDGFAASLAGLEPVRPRVRMISGLTGAPVGDEPLDGAYWRRHAREPVRFAAGVQALLGTGVELVVEVGPHPVLLQSARRGAAADRSVQWLPTLRRKRDDRATLLATIGTLFVAGAALDPARVYADRPRRSVALPTYPFARERHWVDAEPIDGPTGGPTTRPTASTGPWYRGTPVESPVLEDRVFAYHLGARDAAVLREHRVFGVNVISGAVQATLMADACGAVLGDTSAHAFEKIGFRAPLVLEGDQPRAVQVVVTPQEPGAAHLRLFSRDGDDWILHCTAEARAGAELPGEPVDLQAIRERCGETLTGEEYYARGWETGVHELGPAFRSIEALWRRDGEALARVGLRAEASEPGEDAVVRACRLGEVSGQILGAALPGWDAHDEQTSIGLGIARSVDASRGAPPVVYWHAVVHGTPGEGGVTGDVQMLAEDGRVLSRAEGLQLGWIRQDQLRAVIRTARRGRKGPSLSRARLAEVAPEARPPLVDRFLREVLAGACGGEPDQIPRDLSIRDLGVDSLIAVELRERLGADLEIDVPMVELLAGPSVQALTEQVLAAIGGAREPAEPPSPSPTEAKRARSTNRANSSRWLRPLGGAGRTRVIGLPHGGGGASAFAALATALPEVRWLAAQLPGREDRIHEPPLGTIAAMVDALLPPLEALPDDGPVVLLGWSMGALLGFELARALTGRGRAPARLVVGAFPAPDRPRGDGQLVREATAPLDPALREAIEPTLRADLHAVTTHAFVAADPLGCPLTAIGGRDDASVGVDALAGWARQTAGAFDLRVLPGGHLLLRTDPEPLAAALRQVLAQ